MTAPPETMIGYLESLDVEIPAGYGNVQIRCPFHGADKNPSASVNVDLGLFRCFTCGLAGDTYKLLMSQEGLGFADAKRRVGDRMLLSGNVVSQDFLRMTDAQVREQVRAAIRAGAPGGGFTLRCTGGTCGTGGMKTEEQAREGLRKAEVYLDAALEFGAYPIAV